MRGAPRIMTCHLRTALQSIGIGILLLTMLAPLRAAAQGDPLTLASSEPRANAVLATAPEELSLTFSSDVDTEASELRVITEDGVTLDDTETAWDDARSATITMPDGVPRGSYLVAWSVAPTGAGALATGFFGFTVGTDQDVAPVTIPNTGFADPRPLTWSTIGANGAIVLGLTLLIAIWPAWIVMSRTPGGPRRFPLLPAGVAGTVVAGTGVLARIATLAWAEQDGNALERLLSSLGDGTGQLLLLTLVLISVHSLALALLPGTEHGRWGRIAPWVTTLALTIPLPLLSHAPDEPAGRIPTLTVTWLVLTALAALAAGLITLASARPVDAGSNRGAVGILTAVALPTLAIGGAYLAWLYIGNMAALDRTDYGTAAIVAGLATAVFAIAIVVTLVLAKRAGARHLLALPVIAGVILAGSVGALLSLDTARAELTRVASQRTVGFELGEYRAQLILAPGNAGVNHFRLEIDRATLPRQTTAELTMRLPALEEIGSETVT
ncbi:MAG TPA: copper resistance CopC family protein, partial [Thermomicrobiales bacterium]|nr:copper resistance CopC family protein [Thermomicrobiales bacterium]